MKQPSEQRTQSVECNTRVVEISYDELVHRSETLEHQLQTAISADGTDIYKTMNIKGSLKGAKELLFRQDETSEDFTIAVIILLDHASSQF